MDDVKLERTDNAKPVYKSFTDKSDFDKFVEGMKSKLTLDIKEQLEKEAAMTAEQKLQSRIEELEKEKKNVLIDKNKTKAERLFVSEGISEKQYSQIIDFIVTDNEQETLARTTKVLDVISEASKSMFNEKVKSAMKEVVSPKSEAQTQNVAQDSIAKTIGKTKAQTEKRAQETIKNYL